MDSVGIKPDLYGAGREIDLCYNTFLHNDNTHNLGKDIKKPRQTFK